MFFIIPASLDAEITKRLDAAMAEHPDAEADREFLHSQLIEAFDRFGHIPDFSLVKP